MKGDLIKNALKDEGMNQIIHPTEIRYNHRRPLLASFSGVTVGGSTKQRETGLGFNIKYKPLLIYKYQQNGNLSSFDIRFLMRETQGSDERVCIKHFLTSSQTNTSTEYFYDHIKSKRAYSDLRQQGGNPSKPRLHCPVIANNPEDNIYNGAEIVKWIKDPFFMKFGRSY